MDEFFNTKAGRIFYEGTMPRIADALEKIGKALEEEPGTEPSEFKDPHVRLHIPGTNLLVVVSLEGEGVRINVREKSVYGKGINKTIAKKWKLYDNMATGHEDYAELDCYEMSDQPEECRKCGVRTDIIDERDDGDGDKYQIHSCPKCHYVYKLYDCEPEDDEEDISKLDTYKSTNKPELCRKCGTPTKELGFTKNNQEKPEYSIQKCPDCAYKYKLLTSGDE